MRAELGKGSEHIVFVWQALKLGDDEVRIFVYTGMVSESQETYNRGFARSYWETLVDDGFHVVPERVPETLPL